MPWVRFDDQFPIHRKVSGLSDAEYRLHTEAIFWCARNTTDGRIARDELRCVSGISKPDRHVTALVRRGLWIETGEGWEINDYLKYQPSKKKVDADRAAKAAAGRLGGLRSGQSRRSKTEAKPKQSASRLVEHPNPSSSSKKGSEGADANGRPQPPSWCGRCNKNTRIAVSDDDRPIPCPSCHPNRSERAASNGASGSPAPPRKPSVVQPPQTRYEGWPAGSVPAWPARSAVKGALQDPDHGKDQNRSEEDRPPWT